MVISKRPGLSPEEAETFISRRMSLRHLRVVIALAEAKSLSAAAHQLHVTQPAVSKTLSELEHGLGQTLFVRKGRSLRATVLGERLIALARKLEADLRRGGEDVAAMVRGGSGELLVGATNAALAELLPRAAAALKATHPKVALMVRTHALVDLFNDLRQGRLDLVIANAVPGYEPLDLQGQALLHQCEVLTISSNHPLARLKSPSWEALSREAWIWPLPGTRSRALQDQFWQNMGLPLPTNVTHTGDVMLILSMMRRQPLLAIMDQHAALTAAKTGVLKILPQPVKLGLGALTLWNLPEPQSELVEQFKTQLFDVAREIG
jgi:DNA-binding transcriptional LysR family regulator